ncbi:hypothetical protein [Riemerella anatipestifer]|uniref:hypothetical protein n=1 Tax=Riemerella anatipestifer TaxID=34085 RepID=UPI001BDA3F98|nr:hypothetical protein [Riemerella anatipestifer]MBT0554279.1 hypothetical protein [Riemerella anatipestifer]MCE3024984.1 hypothetical protein [Riemerella anatipestifer]MDY3449828.1 hypothetical protein [Riemerella anatipestifer]QYR03352.1 hypothetical protein J6M00_02730 [Riemerella anatipestifer]QYR05621.1 hypothetical protein J6M09_02970 [Riemerella anatipestifer]
MLTHNDLVEIGYKWVVKRCGVALKEHKTICDEIPDVLGFNQHGSFLLEAKTSISDFLVDKNKPFRTNPDDGVGDWRFFITPKGLITVDKLPPNWGLIEVSDNGKVASIYNPFGKGNIYLQWAKCKKNFKKEYLFLYSALKKYKNEKTT